MTFSDKYIFNKESFEDVHRGIKDLFNANHQETGIFDRDFSPDYQRYVALERDGGLAFFTVRASDECVGYAVFFLGHLIYQPEVLAATQSAAFVLKPHRGISLSFMRYCDKELKGLGMNCIFRQSTVKRDIGKIYERMGYQLITKSYRKDL